MLTHIEFENYRIFKKRQVLDIKPITLFFGKNNAGKSAVLKLPILGVSIMKSMEDTSNKGFELKRHGITIANTYRDLIFGRASSVASFCFSNEQGNRIDYSFHVDLGKLIVDKTEIDIKVDGMNTLVDYIGPFRAEPDTDLRLDETVRKTSRPDGALTYQQLIRDVNSTSHILSDKVSQWYKQNFEGWGVYVDHSTTSTGEVYNVVMKINEITTPIGDCGTGIKQSLPIVIRACQPAEEPTLVILEEPESHLNPAAHAELCQLIVDSTKEDTNKRYLIETHSHTFILRLQRLLAEGKISPDDVALYFVQYNEGSSQLERIEMMPDGSIPQWPTGMFEEVMDEILAINNQRILKRK